MVSRKSIVMLAPFFPPAVGPDHYNNGKLALAFLSAGYRVLIITQRPTETDSIDSSRIWNELEPHTVFIDSSLKIGFAARLLGPKFSWHIKGLVWSIRAARKLYSFVRRDPSSVVLSRCYPTYAHWPVAIVYYLVRGKMHWFANWNDPVPASKHIPPLGQGPSGSCSWAGDFMFSQVAKNATFHTFCSDRLRQYMVSYMPKDCGSKSTTIPHISPPPTLRPSSICSNDCLRMVHCGSAFFRNHRQLLEGLSIFVKNSPEKPAISLQFIGWVPEPDTFSQLVSRLGLSGMVTLKSFVPYEECLSVMASSDVLVLLETAFSEGIYLSSKFADYAFCRRPILAVSPPVGTAHDLISHYGGGLYCDCSDPESIARAIRVLYDSWKNGTVVASHVSDELYSYFAPEAIVETYGDIISAVDSQRPFCGSIGDTVDRLRQARVDRSKKRSFRSCPPEAV